MPRHPRTSRPRRRAPLFLPFALAAAAALLAACAKDTILPVASSHCGDGNVDPDEECDLASAGCVQCKVAEGWECDDVGCTTKCGDGLVAGEEECDPPDGITCDSSCWRGTQPAACDMSGYWIARQTNFSKDQAVGATQTSSNWSLYGIEQSGSSFVVKQSLFCGIQVSGTVDVRLSEAGTRQLMYWNPQHVATQDRGGNVRKGTFAESGAGGCDFHMGVHWYLRGAEARFLPPLPWSDPPDPKPPAMPPDSFAGLAPLPSNADTTGAIDLEGTGKLGVSYDITGLTSGSRWAIQRDWEWRKSTAEHPIKQHAIEFVAADVFSNQQNLLHAECPADPQPESCPGTPPNDKCGLLCEGSFADDTADHRIVLRWLGKTLDDPRARRVLVAEPGTDEDADAQSCANVRKFLPHDKTKK